MSEEVPTPDTLAPAPETAESETETTPTDAAPAEPVAEETAAESAPETVEETDAPDADTAEAADRPEETDAADGGDSSVEPAAAEAAASEGAEDGETSEASGEKVAPEASPEAVEGTIIGWNDGGFHVVVSGKTGFCPHSEMILGEGQEAKDMVDQTFMFNVLRVEDKGRRIVLSRRAQVRGERRKAVGKLRGEMEQGAVMTGTVASLKDFGAFIDLGGVQGLLHVSEISRRRIEDPRTVLQEGQEVEVKVLKIEQGGRRISLSMKALEPDPWRDAAEKFPQGTVVKGVVERTANFGAFVEIAPGLTGLLPTSNMSLPRNTNASRVYHPGKEVSVQIVSVDPRRRRVSLGLEGSGTEGSQADLESFRKKQASESTSFNALAAALEKARARSAE